MKGGKGLKQMLGFVIKHNNSVTTIINFTIIRIVTNGDTTWHITTSSDKTPFLTATREP